MSLTFDSIETAERDVFHTPPSRPRQKRLGGSFYDFPNDSDKDLAPFRIKDESDDSSDIEVVEPPKKRKAEVVDLTMSDDDEVEAAPKGKRTKISPGRPAAEPKATPSSRTLKGNSSTKKALKGRPESRGGPPKPILRQCAICFEDHDQDILPMYPHEGISADHQPVCYQCWEQHLHSELERKEWNHLTCPTCNTTLQQPEINALDVYFNNRIEPLIMDKATKAYLHTAQNWVQCPSGTCQSGAEMDGGGHIFTCQDCGYRYCTSCEVLMHENEACSEYQERLRREPEKLREEEESKKTVEKHSKACPKCSTRLQKSDGCDHFTCKACKHEFCWVCFADYKGARGVVMLGNAAHNQGCKYLPAALPTYVSPGGRRY